MTTEQTAGPSNSQNNTAVPPGDPGVEEVVRVTKMVHREIADILERSHRQNSKFVYNSESYISHEKVLEAVRYALQDLDNVEISYGRTGMFPALTKYVGYIGYWVAKLKPITEVRTASPRPNEPDPEMLDVNEKIVFPLINRLIYRIVQAGGGSIAISGSAAETRFVRNHLVICSRIASSRNLAVSYRAGWLS